MSSGQVETQQTPPVATGQDKFVTWGLLGHRAADWANYKVADATYRVSLMPEHTISDSTYLRASIGNIWFLLPVLGLIAGMAAAHSTGGLPLPPTTFLFCVLMVLGILDAFSGFVGFLVFLVWVVATGHMTSFHAAAGTIGLGIMWFGGAQLAHTFRKPSLWDAEPTKALRRWRIGGDIVILPIAGGFLLGKLVVILPYLTGYKVPIVHDETVITIVAMAAFVVRAVLETLVIHNYRDRLASMQQPEHDKRPLLGTILATILRAACVFVVLWSFLGNQVATYIVLLLFMAFEPIVWLGHRFPESTFFARVTPRNLFKLTLVIIAAEILVTVVTPHFNSTRIATGWIFVLLTLFTVVLLLLEQFKGKPWPEVWLTRFLGAASVVLFVVVLQGYIHF